MAAKHDRCPGCHRLRVRRIRCNLCGRSLEVQVAKGITNTCGLVEVEVRGSYGSPVLKDFVTYRFSLCERCLEELFQRFKLPVEMGGGS